MPAAISTQAAREAVSEQFAGKYINFRLADEEYGLEILTILEIIQMQPVTRVSQTLPYLRGVITLRGKAIPVIDLRERFSFSQDGGRPCIMVAQAKAGSRHMTLGAIIDEDTEAMNIDQENIDESPFPGTGIPANHGIGTG